MWTLTRLLQFFIRSFIPENDPYWELFILLGKITDIIFAPKVTHRMLAQLEDYMMIITVYFDRYFL